MKLLRYGLPGAEKPGLLGPDGRVRDLSVLIPDIGPDQLRPETLRALSSLPPAALPEVAGRPRLGPPVTGIRQFIAIGLNYSDHAAEAKLPVPEEPVIFLKGVSSICGPEDDLVPPPGSQKLDWEVELAIVIGSEAYCIGDDQAQSHIAGYMLANDISERSFQLERGGTWDKGKAAPGFGPLGPWLVTADEITNVQSLDLWLDVNGVRQQSGSTADMIFGVDHLVGYVSRFMRLLPGDVIITGTPAGVALGREESAFLRPGDLVELGISGLGQQTLRVRA